MGVTVVFSGCRYETSCKGPTRTRRHLEHLGSLRTCRHIHHRRLLMSLLRVGVTHHLRSRSWTVWITICARCAGHMPWVLRICLAGSWRIHLHLRVAWHTHRRTIGWLMGHHMSTHLRSSRRSDELAGLAVTQTDVLYVRAHAILRHLHLLRVSGHWLWLGTIHVGMHWARRGMYR